MINNPKYTETDMNTTLDVGANLTVMPMGNLIVIGVFALLLIGAIVAALKFLKINKIGSIELMNKQTFNITTLYHMNTEIDKVDFDLQTKLSDMIDDKKIHVRNIMRNKITSDVLVEAMATEIAYVQSGMVVKNHMTREFETSNRKSYKDKILQMLEEYFADARYRNKTETGEFKAITWDDISEECVEIIDEWFYESARRVMRSCEEKIEIYSKYMSLFSGEEFFVKICSSCIDKNKKYISDLDTIRKRGSRHDED